MRLSARLILSLAAVSGVSQLACTPLHAQPLTNSPARHVSAVATPLAPPAIESRLAKSPVAFFRELLAMNLAERQKALADRAPENRKQILAKVREYESLKPNVREMRLQVTELRWYLWPLMNMAPENRAGRLEQIPAAQRGPIEDRLREWDKLPVEVQKQLLDNEATVRYFTELQDNPRRLTNSISPAAQAKLQKGIRQWQSLSEEQRQQIASRFRQFFDLTHDEKEQALNTLSEPERLQIQKTLQAFGQLPQGQRALCIRSFEKFASLSLVERQQFLKNAARWKLMTPEERQSWRELVSRVPMMPPDASTAPIPRPPAAHGHPGTTVATNGG